MTLLLAGVSEDNRHGRVLTQFVGQRFAADHGMPDIDQAMERAELSLLALAGHEPLREVVPIEQVNLMDGLDAAQRARLAACLQPRQLAAGESCSARATRATGCMSSPRVPSTCSVLRHPAARHCGSAT
jgi:hypothetical protein